jgi:hypothetical protein
MSYNFQLNNDSSELKKSIIHHNKWPSYFFEQLISLLRKDTRSYYDQTNIRVGIGKANEPGSSVGKVAGCGLGDGVRCTTQK